MLKSLLSPIINLILITARMIGRKKKFTEIILTVFGKITESVLDLIEFGKLSTKEILDESLTELDLRLGSDPGAIDIVPDLPADKEEELTDHLKEVIRILGYNKLKIAGYYIAEGIPDAGQLP